MTYEEWWASYVKPASIYTLKETTEDAWEAGIQEGLRRNREWVGITNEDYDGDWVNDDGNWIYSDEFLEGVDWAEAKLKELNT